MNKLLTICIPTYNRKDVLINEVRDYLSVNDDRFCIKVSDNCSTDGTQEALKEFQDDRLIVNFNTENLGSIPNWIVALSNNQSDYLIFTLDKDIIDISQLIWFLNFLEQEQPCFGYVDLNISKPKSVESFGPGYDNILKMAYLDKHPSGYFYRRDIFENAIKRDSFLKLDKKFDFPFEVINAELAVEYPSVIIKGGLVINANYRKELQGNKTRSYDESNIWFGAPRRFVEYGYYIYSVLNLQLPSRQNRKLAVRVTKMGINNVTFALRSLMSNEPVCIHYNVKPRTVGIVEMYNNTIRILDIFKESAKGSLPSIFILLTVLKMKARFFALFILSSFRRFFK